MDKCIIVNYDVSYSIVTADSVTVASAANQVVSEGVSSVVALGTNKMVIVERHT